MNIEEKVAKYFQEIENVFGTPEKIKRHFELLESNEDYKKSHKTLAIGIHHKNYTLTVEVNDTELSSWVMTWLYSANNGGSIGGVRIKEISWEQLNKESIKNKLQEVIDSL